MNCHNKSQRNHFRKQAQHRGVTVPNRKISGAGFSFALDKIISALNSINGDCGPSTDVVVCVTGSQPILREVTPILQSLWAAGIQCAVVESYNAEEAQDMAKDMGCKYYVIVPEEGSLRLRFWLNDRFEERLFNREELSSHLKRILKPETDIAPTMTASNTILNTNEFSTKNNKSTVLFASTAPNVMVNFPAVEKAPASTRRWYENLLTQQLASVLALFNKDVVIEVIIVDLPSEVMRAVACAIDPRQIKTKQNVDSISAEQERHSEYRRHIKDITKKINDIYLNKKAGRVICLYHLKESSYRFIL